MTFKTIEQVWDAIDRGETVYWSNKSYALTIEDSELAWRKKQGFKIPFSNRNGKCLRVTCTSNYFGSLLEPKELSNLFTETKE